MAVNNSDNNRSTTILAAIAGALLMAILVTFIVQSGHNGQPSAGRPGTATQQGH